MKGSRIYIVAIVVFMAILFFIEHSLPKKFVWRPTFSQRDHQPLGCAVFDDVLSASMPNGYSVTTQTLYQLKQDSTQMPNMLMVENRIWLDNNEIESLYTLLHRGARLMLVGSGFNQALCDTLKFSVNYGYFNLKTLKEYVANNPRRDTLFYAPDPAYPKKQEFYVYPQFCATHFTTHDSLCTPLIQGYVSGFQHLNSRDTYALSWQIGKGELILVSTPLLFTNYGMLDGNNHTYIFRLMSHLKDMPVVRIESYTQSLAQEQRTPLRYILSQTPLRWALYGTMLLVLLFMIFTARRRQRAIPVVKKPANRSLEFVKLIGTLYFHRKGHSDLLMKKYIYFADTLRKEIQVDVDSGEPDEELARRIATKTGSDETRVLSLLYTLRKVQQDALGIDETQLSHLIDEMNEIITHI